MKPDLKENQMGWQDTDGSHFRLDNFIIISLDSVEVEETIWIIMLN